MDNNQLQRALTDIAKGLLDQADTAALHPHTLMQRSGDLPMHEEPDQFATNTPVTQRAVIHKRRRWNGTLLRFGLGALSGVLVTGAVFISRGNNDDTTTVDVNADAPKNPYLLLAGAPPQGLCLQFVATFQNLASQPNPYQPTVLKRGAKEVISILATFGSAQGPDKIVGETVDINGTRGVLTGSDRKQINLGWTKGQTYIQVTANNVPKAEVIAIAQSVVMSFDENGVRIAGVNAPGFSAADPADFAPIPYGSQSYGECRVTDPNNAQRNIGITTSKKVTTELGNPYEADDQKKSKTNVTRESKQIEAERVDTTTPDGKYTFSTINWTEKDTLVSVSFSQLTDEAGTSFIASLKPATAEEFERLREEAQPPSFQAPGEPERTTERKIGTIQLKQGKATIRSAVSNGLLCISLDTGSSFGGGGCVKLTSKPKLMPNWSDGTGRSAAYTVVNASIAKATATFPDGSTRDLSTFQDERLPSARVIVQFVEQDDPIATKITFYDATGKVVHVQDSESGPGPTETIVPAVPVG